jgi:hypothetical protein
MLKSLSEQRLYAGRFIPSPTTIANWAIRAGLAKLLGVKRTNEPCIDIMDHWIGNGHIKLFAVLRLPLSACEKRLRAGQALDLKAFKLVHLGLGDKSNGVIVCRSLEKLYSRIGLPVGVICDGGSDLNKGIKLLNYKQDSQIILINDISHKVATLAKKQFADRSWFKDFCKNIQNGQKKLINSEIAYLRSPKQNTKARFMNISRIINWAVTALERMENSADQSSHMKKFRAAYGPLTQQPRSMILHMKQTLDVADAVMKVLKIQGLNDSTAQEARLLIAQLPATDTVRLGLEDWLLRHEVINQSLKHSGWTSSLPISSDPIESLFSRYKALQNRAPSGDPTRLVLILPLFVGEHSAADLYRLIQGQSQAKTSEWVKTHVPESIHAKKRKLVIAKQERKVTKIGHAPQNRERPCVRAIAA